MSTTFEGGNTGQPVEQSTANSHHGTSKIKMRSRENKLQRKTNSSGKRTTLSCHVHTPAVGTVPQHRPRPTTRVLGIHHWSHLPHGRSLALVTERGCITAPPSAFINLDSLRRHSLHVCFKCQGGWIKQDLVRLSKWVTLQLFTENHIPPFN